MRATDFADRAKRRAGNTTLAASATVVYLGSKTPIAVDKKIGGIIFCVHHAPTRMKRGRTFDCNEPIGDP